MYRKYIVAGVILLVIVGALIGVKAMQIRSMVQAGASFKMPPETISSVEVRKVQWDASLSAVGTVTAVQGVLLRTELSGIVKKIAFESGAIVQPGQILVELDRSAEEAQLRSAEANADLARANMTRARDLKNQQVLSQSELDSAEAAFKQTAGEADGIRAAIAKKIIRAPFAGRLGIRQIQLGQFADAGTPIVPLQSLDPVYIDFSLPEQAAAQIRRGMRVRVTSDAVPGRTFEGPLTAINPEVDASSRNLKLQATLSGIGGVLLPGMFAQVALVLPEQKAPIVIPVTAVLNAPYGDSVFVIADARDEKTGKVSKRVQMTTVKLGETRGDLVVVEHGLEPGQQIASSGIFKLRNNSEVVVNNALAPSAGSNPRPADS
jgi:membrane fusion protein (multidrug efflux system)